MTFTVMIATRDRASELELTCSKLLELEPPPDEVIVCADGCTDQTGAIVKARFSQFRFLENPSPRGSVFSRDRMLRLAKSDIVVSLDDDSYPMHRDFFVQLAQVFRQHSEAAVIVFPELRSVGTACDPRTTADSRGHYVAAYANCAAAMRKRFYLQRPGFASFFEHMYEEPDYALQCYAAGAGVWFEPSLAVRHSISPSNRNLLRRHHSNARNELWSVWLRCPWPWLPLVCAYRVARQFLYAASQGLSCAAREPFWWLDALQGIQLCYRARQAVPWKIYRRWMILARHPLYSSNELERRFGSGARPSSAAATEAYPCS
jgi:glycosyltransferase involved in cell wall biosynthesis